jgi:hypothetical protein
VSSCEWVPRYAPGRNSESFREEAEADTIDAIEVNRLSRDRREDEKGATDDSEN